MFQTYINMKNLRHQRLKSFRDTWHTIALAFSFCIDFIFTKIIILGFNIQPFFHYNWWPKSLKKTNIAIANTCLFSTSKSFRTILKINQNVPQIISLCELSLFQRIKQSPDGKDENFVEHTLKPYIYLWISKSVVQDHDAQIETHKTQLARK